MISGKIINSVIYGECIQAMENIPSKFIDMILCNLPYRKIAPKWAKNLDLSLLWKNYNRIIKDCGTIALFSTQPFTSELIISNEKDFKYCWYWIKNQATNFYHAKRRPMRRIEEICIFKKGKYYPQITNGHVPTNSAKGCSGEKTYYGINKRNYTGGKTTRFPNNVLEFKCVDNYSRLHRSEKPIALLEYLIKTYTDKNDIVLDNCAGSGATGIACINTKRNYILIEKEEKYYEIAGKRISEN